MIKWKDKPKSLTESNFNVKSKVVKQLFSAFWETAKENCQVKQKMCSAAYFIKLRPAISFPLCTYRDISLLYVSFYFGFLVSTNGGSIQTSDEAYIWKTRANICYPKNSNTCTVTLMLYAPTNIQVEMYIMMKLPNNLRQKDF